MRVVLFIAVAILAAGCARQQTPPAPQGDPTPAAATPTAASPIAASATGRSHATMPAAADKNQPARIKPLTAEQQGKLLRTRLDGGMHSSFGQFANMFLVSSRINLGYGIGLMTDSQEISDTTLQSPFPRFYQPTFREFLDAIALQTFSEWKYDPSSKYIKIDVQIEAKHDAPYEGLAMFEFTKREKARVKPFQVTLAEGWKEIDKGNWTMLVPPTFPVGLDIYEMGSYSADDKNEEPELLKKVRTEVALEWARRVRENAGPQDLKPAKVGPYDALFFESMAASRTGQAIRWRQWVFVVANQCYFVVSTILPEFEKKIYPDVEKMLRSFHVKKG